MVVDIPPSCGAARRRVGRRSGRRESAWVSGGWRAGEWTPERGESRAVEVGASEKGENWGLVVSVSSIGKDVETPEGRSTYRRPSQSISSPLLALRTISHDQRSLATSVHSMVGIPIQVAKRRSKRAETERASASFVLLYSLPPQTRQQDQTGNPASQ